MDKINPPWASSMQVATLGRNPETTEDSKPPSDAFT